MTQATESTILEVKGIRWASSKVVADTRLARRPGVLTVDTNVVAQTATVTFDPNADRYRVCWDGNAPLVHVRGADRLEIRSRLQYIYLEDGDRLELGVGAVLEFRAPRRP